MSWETFAEQFGAIILLGLYIFIKEGIPQITQKWLPHKLEELDDERKRKIQQEEEDRLWRKEYEQSHQRTIDQIAKTQEELSKNYAQASVSMAQTNERIASIMTNQLAILAKSDVILDRQDKTDTFLVKAVAEMRETVAAETGRRPHKKDTGPFKNQLTDRS